VTSFDAVAKAYGTSYSDIIAKATQAGWTPTPRTPFQALFLVPMMLSGSWWATQSAVFSGEIKKIGRSQLIGMVLSIAAMTTAFFVIYASIVAMVGYDFGNAVAYFAFNDPSAVSVPVLPYPTMFYFGLAAKNIVLTLIIALGGVVGLMMFVPWGIMIFSRYLFAMSFDRVLPEFVSNVNERLHTPVNAIALATFFSLVLMYIFQFLSTIPYAVGWIFYIGIGANELLQVSVFISAIALALLPYIRRQLYEQAFPFKRKIAGIPVATWSGLLTLGIVVYSQYVWFLSPPWSQMIYGGFPEIAYLCLGFGILLVLIYFAVNIYRKHQAIDLSLVFKEIPPE
jgi:amino acid transporter